jgi:nicotinamidase-related amidase
MKIFLANIFLFVILIASCNSSARSRVNNNGGCAVVVMDIQKHFMQKKISKEESEALIYNINKFQEKIKDKADMVYVRSILTVLNVSLGGIDIDTLDGLDFDNRLELKTDNIYKKDKANAFTSDNFVEFLNKKDIGTLYIVGVMAEHCVYKTAYNALKRGYRVILVKDAIQGRNKDSMNKILDKLKDKGAQVVSLDEI